VERNNSFIYQDTATVVPVCELFIRRLVSARDVKMSSQEIQFQM